MRRKMRRKVYRKKDSLLGILVILLFGWAVTNLGESDIVNQFEERFNMSPKLENVQGLESLHTYDGKNMVVTVNDNQPSFAAEDLAVTPDGWQTFSDLDGLNRVGPANALLHKNMMPDYKRGDISTVYPSGWNQKKLGKNDWLYDRCHLVGFQLTGEDANWKNLFTGTAQMNRPATDSMLEYENVVAKYVRNTENHVRYRVTPYFVGEELVCRGVQMEAQSIEDDQVSFNVFVFNTCDNVTIDYVTGRATLDNK